MECDSTKKNIASPGHGVRVADYQLTAWEEYVERIQTENARTHPHMKVVGMRWLGGQSRGNMRH